MTSVSAAEPKTLLARKGSATPAGVHGRRETLGGRATPNVVKLDAIEGGLAKQGSAAALQPDAPEAEGADVAPAASLTELDLVKTGAALMHLPKAAPKLGPAAPAAKPVVSAQAQARVVTPSRDHRAGRWLLPGAAVVALAGICAIGWYAFLVDVAAPKRPADVATTEPAARPEREAAPGGSEDAGGIGRPSSLRAGASAIEAGPVAATPSTDAGPELPASDEPQAGEVAPPETLRPAAPAGPAVAGPPTEAAREPEPVSTARAVDKPLDSATAAEPSVDVVRIEPDGSAVIAGRAAPRSELIILDNGRPIGTASADAFGEWVFIPTSPLAQGDHEFGLVVKSVQGRVSVPARDAEKFAPVPGDAGGAASEESVPVPARKPSSASPDEPGPEAERSSADPSGADFVVQLASVKTRAGAKREWLKLQKRFPNVLAGMRLSLDVTKLNGRGTVIRVRTGAFAERREAMHFCARFQSARQDCLVVKTSNDG